MGTIQVLSWTPQECVIYTPPAQIGIRFGIVANVVFLVLALAFYFIPKLKADSRPWVGVLLYVVTAWYVPLRIAGSSQRAVFSRADGTVTISERVMLPKKPVVIPLDEVSEAIVGGRYSWLELAMKDGGDLSLSPDSAMGGRENARDAINAWLDQDRDGAGR